ncbi:MAG: MaoC family dehydratase N-terminal domain-containing protein [Deltaproteobacteria bacterium]|nr:MaoC family dehydratase N-terminal domain-containing protein [Deltaproteobacteria bacterium]
MALNRELVGKSYPGTAPWVVAADHVRAYALATQSENPRYVDPLVAGGQVAPPIYGVVVGQRAVEQLLLDPELAVDTTQLLHTEQHMRFGEPMRPGEALTYEAIVVAIGDERGGENLDVALRVRRSDGSLAYDSLVRLFIRTPGVKRTGQERRADIPGVLKRSLPPQITASSSPLFEQTLHVADDQSLRYADASGDYNPIHRDPALAKAAGLPGIILHGMCTLAMAQNALVDQGGGGDPALLKALGGSFTRRVQPGDDLTVRAHAAAESQGVRTIGFEVTKQNGKAVIKDGVAEFAR